MGEEYFNYMGYVSDILGRNGTSSYMTYGRPDTEFIGDGRIKIPDTFKDVILKLCPEISNITTIGYKELTSFNSETFIETKKYIVGIDIHFDDKNNVVKSKKDYDEIISNYFVMTYSDMDFIMVKVQSLVFPPEKTNEDKFFELFGK